MTRIRCWMLCAALLCPVSAPAADAPQPPVTLQIATPVAARTPVPAGPALLRAEKLVREVFALDYARRQPDQRLRLARKLLQQAEQTRDDAAARYVLLREARDLAAALPEAPLLMQALQRLDDLYPVDLPSMALDSLATANRAAAAPPAAAAVARACLRATDQAVDRDDHDAATRLCAIARGAAERAREVALVQRASARERELRALTAEFNASRSARALLLLKPDDADANLAAGAYLCLVKGDWTQGLPMLARAPDSPLRSAAQSDLARPDDSARQFALGNIYWDLAAAESALKQHNLQSRAAHWYRRALPALTGINATAAASRIHAVDTALLRARGLAPGLLAELFRGVDFAEPVKSRIDPSVDFDWGNDAPDPDLPKDNFSIRWTGMLHLPGPGRYEITVIANASARILIDGNVLIDDPNLTRKRKGVSASFESQSTLLPIRIDYADTTGLAKMRLLWTTPGTVKPLPIPPTALWHDSQ